jgi:hypothetical protein
LAIVVTGAKGRYAVPGYPVNCRPPGRLCGSHFDV